MHIHGQARKFSLSHVLLAECDFAIPQLSFPYHAARFLGLTLSCGAFSFQSRFYLEVHASMACYSWIEILEVSGFMEEVSKPSRLID